MKTDLSELTKNLSKNMIRYMELKEKLDEIAEEQEEINTQNLAFAKLLGLKKGDYVVFEEIDLQLQLIEMVKKLSLDEEGLVKMYGKEKTDYLRIIPIKSVELAIKMKKLPAGAEDFIVKDDPTQYTKISRTGFGVESKEDK